MFRRPLPGSTNYLNAYNKRGELIRQTLQNRQDEELGQQRKDQRKKQSQPRYEAEDEADREEKAEEVLPDGEMARREETVRRLEAAATPSETKLPPEHSADLRPFPLNPNFTSEPVLSEELREIIYVRVKEQERPIREVSAEFKVSMERVAAVVRMKQMERDWLAKVRHRFCYFVSPQSYTLHDEFQFQNSISLEDTNVVIQNNVELLSDFDRVCLFPPNSFCYQRSLSTEQNASYYLLSQRSCDAPENSLHRRQR